MTIGFMGLLAIVLTSMSIGCCVGVVVMAMCKVSVEERSEIHD
jgi:hypothetical protein